MSQKISQEAYMRSHWLQREPLFSQTLKILDSEWLCKDAIKLSPVAQVCNSTYLADWGKKDGELKASLHNIYLI